MSNRLIRAPTVHLQNMDTKSAGKSMKSASKDSFATSYDSNGTRKNANFNINPTKDFYKTNQRMDLTEAWITSARK